MFGVFKTSGAGSSIGYTTYVALLTQTGTNAPVATVLENSLGGTVVWSYVAAGQYTATLSGAFALAKTFVVLGASANGGSAFFYDVQMAGAPNSFNIYIRNAATQVVGDDLLLYNPIEIRVYP
jgi:hypothetical protein